MKYIFFIVLIFPSIVQSQAISTDTAALHKTSKPLSTIKTNPSNDESGFSDAAKSLHNLDDLIVYPEEAKKLGLEGKVTFAVLVDESGKVQKVDIEKADNDIFRQPVIEAVSKIHFPPSRKNGKPTMIWYIKSVLFKLYPEEIKPHQY